MKHFVYLVGLHIYYKMIHGPYNIKRKIVFVILLCVFQTYKFDKKAQQPYFTDGDI